MNRSSFLVSICLVTIAAASCSGDKKLELGGSCSLNSDCTSPLVCKLGSCRKECVRSVDCDNGGRCVSVDGVAVCQTEKESNCDSTGNCQSPLVCRTVDNTCRTACSPTNDTCVGGQTCNGTVCLENKEVANPGKDASTGASDGAAAPDVESAGVVDGAAGPDASLPGDAPAPAADAPSQAKDGAPVGGGDASPGADAPATGSDGSATGGRDSAGSTGDASVLVPPDLKPTNWGDAPAATDAIISVTAVAVPTSARAGEEITVTVAATVGGFSIANPTALTLGGQPANKVTISGASDVEFTATLTVPHGITPGIVDLGFSCQSGQALASSVLQVTPISVSITGNDLDRGIPDKPFRTVTKAAQTAGVGDTIQVGSGEFSTAETWPAFPDKVTVLGAGVNSTFFKYVGTSYTWITFVGDAVFQEIGLTAFCGFHVTVPRSTVFLENVTVDHAGACSGYDYLDLEVQSYATGAKVTVAGKMTSMLQRVTVGATNVSLVLSDGVFGSVTTRATGSDLRVQGATLGDPLVSTSNHNVLNTTSAANVVFDHATVNGEIALASKSTLSVADSSFRFSTGSVGVSTIPADGYSYAVYGQAVGNLKATLTNSTFDGGQVQLQVGVNDDVVVRGCKFSGYEKYGVYAMGALTNLDLGTATDSGGNEFTGSTASSIYGLYDYRTAVGPTITVSGTSFNGVIPPAGAVTKSTTVAACEPGAYCINTIGNSITFY